MRPPTPFRRTWQHARAWLVAPVAAILTVTLLGAPAQAANPVTPGNFTGLGFDQCEAPSQSAMTAWRRSSPFRAVGIYISGDSRACQRQTNLTPTWVANQLAAGWKLMPITLGPQASCTTRARYLQQVRINPDPTGTYAKARQQGAAEATEAIAVARRLGIVAGSTLFYDLEAFDIRKSTACTASAKWFVSEWTRALRAQGYVSGFYSSAASGIRMLDDARVTPGNPFTLPHQVWIADWDGRANTSSAYVRSDGWQPYARAKQFQGGHNETWGGVTINIDRNYLNLRTPSWVGAPAPAPAPAPSPVASPRFTGANLSDGRCTTATISRPTYGQTTSTYRTQLIAPLQCVLKQQKLYPYEVTATWNTQTTTALNAFQRRVGHPVLAYASGSDWVSLLVAGNTGRTLRRGSTGSDVIMLQRGLNAAGWPRLRVNGIYTLTTAKAVGAYQRRVGLKPSRVVGARTWSALRAGRG